MFVEHDTVVATIAGFVGGGFVGSLIATQTEMNRRATNNSGSVSLETGAFRSLLFGIVPVLVASAALSLVVFLAMRIGRVDSFRGNSSIALGAAIAIGALVGKYVRYLYWKSR